MKKQKGHIHLIIGASKLGAAIAVKRAKEGQYVTVIDKDKEARYKLGDNYLGSFIAGDATLLSVLKDSNIENAKEIVIVTESDDINIYLANVIYKLYNKEKIVVRLNDNHKSNLLLDKKVVILNPFLESFLEYEKIVVAGEK